MLIHVITEGRVLSSDVISVLCARNLAHDCALADGLALHLGNGAKNRQEESACGLGRVDQLVLRGELHAIFLQLLDRLQKQERVAEQPINLPNK
ncbi:MAG: hypothetical protein PHZ00_00500 [Candidatus Peribacteraceae bacterium]|nr:hypothetical protein [Candidatus Peribacteraceae bacterium]